MEENKLDALGAALATEFDTEQKNRRYIEDRWLSDLRQFRGIYEPDEIRRMDPNRATSFSRMTRTKVKSATARLMDMVFPAGTQDNWSIRPSPVPELPANPRLIAAVTNLLGRPPTTDELQTVAMQQAVYAAGQMEHEIRDQMLKIKYRDIMRNVLHSGNLYGTGFLKGPLVNQSYKKTWELDPSGKWSLSTKPINLPYIESVLVWEVYPESAAVELSDARYVWQRTIKPAHELQLLAAREDFKADVIREYVRANRDGDTRLQHWETELKEIGLNLSGNYLKSRRYELKERWGVLDIEDLRSAGLELPDDSIDEYWSNIWLLGSKIIKVEVQPIEGLTVPFYAYYWDKDETSIFGEGIPSIMRDDQKSLNASKRAMQDNAAISAGSQLEVNVDLLDTDVDTRQVIPFKVWARRGIGIEAQYPAIRSIDVPSHVNELKAMADMFANDIHEATLPSYMHGEGVSKGSVGRTASGLSMLMTAAQITFKDQLASIDSLQSDFITGMYYWNMQFNPKEDIKGDLEVKVDGTSSLVSREIRAQNLADFARDTQNEFDAPHVDRNRLNRERAKVLELPDGVVVSPEQAINNLVEQELRHGTENTSRAGAGVPIPAGPPQSQSFDGGAAGTVTPAVEQAANLPGAVEQGPFG